MTNADFIHVFQPAAKTGDIVFLALHGTGGDENDLLSLCRAIRETAGYLGVRGKENEHGHHRYFKRLAPNVFDAENILFRTNELAGFIENAKQKYKITPRRLVALGYSNGANMAALLLLHKPTLLDNAILFRPLLAQKPAQEPDLRNQRVLVIGGSYDQLITPDRTHELVTYLESARATVQTQWLESGHGLTNDDISIAREWVQDAFKKT